MYPTIIDNPTTLADVINKINDAIFKFLPQFAIVRPRPFSTMSPDAKKVIQLCISGSFNQLDPCTPTVIEETIGKYLKEFVGNHQLSRGITFEFAVDIPGYKPNDMIRIDLTKETVQFSISIWMRGYSSRRMVIE